MHLVYNPADQIDAWEADPEADELEEGDLVTEDFNHFYHHDIQSTRLPGLTIDPDDRRSWREAVQEYFERIQYWPNVWRISDHGNAEIVSDLYQQEAA